MELLTFSLLAAVAALVSTGLILGGQLYFSRQRQKRFQKLELIPNILMTRYPLLFVGRARSLFRLGGDFLEMPIYLQEHGYQVEEIEVLKRNDAFKTLLLLLETTRNPVHMIVSEALASAAYDLALDGHPKLATLTIIGERTMTPAKSTIPHHIELRPSRLPVFERPELRPSILAKSFMTEEIALEHMVSLAEYDLR